MSSKPRQGKLPYLLALFIALTLLSGCHMPGLATPTATPPPTNTPLPPTATPLPPTNTLPPPTPTFTVEASPTLLPTLPPPPTQAGPATPTPKYPDAIVLYYFNLNEKGRFGCGENLWYVNTGRARSADVTVDIKFALQRLFSYHGQYWGILYNPYGASQFAVNEVNLRGDGIVDVFLTGTHVPSKDPCDRRRLIDQIRQTCLQFKGISNLNVYLNGTALADALSRK